jgi:ParB-like chromosome segregation protein Spo0J
MARVDSAGNVDKIAQSIQQGAAVPPITVVELGANRYRIIDGHHRYHAYQQAGIGDIPVQIIPRNQVRYTDELLPK